MKMFAKCLKYLGKLSTYTDNDGAGTWGNQYRNLTTNIDR